MTFSNEAHDGSFESFKEKERTFAETTKTKWEKKQDQSYNFISFTKKYRVC